MAPSLFEKAKFKARRLLHAAPPESAFAPSPPTSSPTPSQSASEPATQPTSQPTPSSPAWTDSKTSPLPNLQERLWNQAYDELKASEPKLVEAYEKILSVGLHRKDPSSVTCESTENEIEGARQTRCRQMQQLVRDGLDRTQKAASIKRGIDDGLQAVQAVRGIVDKAIQAAPEAAIAWVGVCLGLEILSNPVTEARYNRNGIAYVLSRMEWYWNLVSLLLVENKAEQSSAGLRVQLEKHVVQLYEKLLSYQVKSVCLYHRNWAAVVLRDVFRLDDWAGQLDDIQKAEAAVQRDSEQYNTELVKSHLRDLADAAHSQELKLQDIHSALQDQTRQQEKRYQDDKDKLCLKDLHLTDPRDDKKRIQDTKGGLLRDSYRWVLNHPDFQRFRDDPQSRLLWIKGDPGKGKTMLLCGIIDELEKDSANRLSYFFCQATVDKLSNATAVLRGLIWLLVIKHPSLISYVRVKYDVAGEKLFEGTNVWVSLTEILTDMLEDPISEDVVLVVDALDECSANRQQLIGFVTQASSLSRAKWIVSSRNWPDIEAQLEDAQNVRIPLELNKDSISSAVNAYIRYKVDRLAHDKKYDQEMRDAVQRHLILNADDTFLWVALVCQELADSKVRKWHTLAKLKLFPPGLDSLYKRMMEHICALDDADICKQILTIASVVYRPISLKEVKVLVESLKDFNDGDLQEIIRSCGSFLTLQEGIISFVHQSAKDFLLNKAADQILPFGLEHQHRMVFSRSLEVLSSTLRRDIYSLRDPGISIDQVSTPESDPLASSKYSCIYWVSHLSGSDPAERMGDDKGLQDGSDVYVFLKEKFLYWLESLSLLRSMLEGVMAMQQLQALVGNMEARQLTELLRDAYRFILSHKRAIEIAPLQVYASPLLFSPSRSLVRKLFKEDEPDWIMLKPIMEENWNSCLHTLEDHDEWVVSVAFSADGQWIASGSHDKTVDIWHVATGTGVQSLWGHDDSVGSVVFSADSKQVASGSDDNTVKIWDMATGICTQTLKGHNSSVNSVAFSADSQRVASGSDDKTVKIWDTATGICMHTFRGHNKPVKSVAFSTDCQRVVSGSNDKTVNIWDVATGACVQTLKGHNSSVDTIAFSADCQQVATALVPTGPTVDIWDTTTGACMHRLLNHDVAYSIAFSEDGQRIVSGLCYNTVKIWDTATGICLQTLKGHGGPVRSVAFSADGQQVASGSDDNTVKIWDAAPGTDLQTLEEHDGPVYSIAFSADGQRVLSVSGRYGDIMLKVWDATTGACLRTIEDRGCVRAVVLSADSQRIASGSDDNTVKIWDMATGICLQTLKGHDGPVWSVASSADGQQVASGSSDNTVKIWDTATGICLQTLKGHGGPVRSVAFSADGQQVASGSDDNTVKIWDIATGICMQTLKGYTPDETVAFSADSQRVALGSHYSKVKIWDVATGACEQTLYVDWKIIPFSFDPMANSRLSTNVGALDLDVSPVIDTPLREHFYGDVSHCGYGISLDGIWIVKDGKRRLWLPPEYRGSCSAVMGSSVAIGCGSGRVLVMQFL